MRQHETMFKRSQATKMTADSAFEKSRRAAFIGLAMLPFFTCSNSALGVSSKDSALDRFARRAPMISMDQGSRDSKCYVHDKDIFFKRNGKTDVTENLLKDGEHPVENGVKCTNQTVFVLLDSKRLLVIRKFDGEGHESSGSISQSVGGIIDSWSIPGLFNQDFRTTKKPFATDMKVNDDGANFVTEDGVLVSIPTSGDLSIVKTQLSARLEQPMLEVWKGFVVVAPNPGHLIIAKRTGDTMDVHYSRIPKNAHSNGFHLEGDKEMFGDMELIKTGDTPLEVRAIRSPHIFSSSR